jgi:hypothetical protein
VIEYGSKATTRAETAVPLVLFLSVLIPEKTAAIFPTVVLRFAGQL